MEVVWFNDPNIDDIGLVGGKNQSLGKMIGNLANLDIKVPMGFAVTSQTYEKFIGDLQPWIQKQISNIHDLETLQTAGKNIREAILEKQFDISLAQKVANYYEKLDPNDNRPRVAVRSSSTAEDLPDASFAGQQDTYLNVQGIYDVLDAVKRCFASLYNDRAISYRQKMGFSHVKTSISVGVQLMARSDEGSAGVAFSLDTETGFRNVVLINGSWGLGEMVVSGEVNPDEFVVSKRGLELDYDCIIDKRMGDKDQKMIYDPDLGNQVVDCGVEKDKFCLPDEVITQLASWVVKLEKYYDHPVDTEWAYDGSELYIVQARPETVQSRRDNLSMKNYKLLSNGTPILTGTAVGDKIAFGTCRVLADLTEMDKFEKGDVLVASTTTPDWEPIMRQASAIITDKGGRTCHSSIVAREMGVPAIVGTNTATQILDGLLVTVSCAEGNVGCVYDGELEYEVTETMLHDLPEVKTPIMMNIAAPDIAFKYAHLPNAGVGLVREEFIINNFIKVHPLALLNHKKLGDARLSKEVKRLMRGFDSEEDFFIKKLAFGLAQIAWAFEGKDVIVRFSDFKSNEYANLLGGKYYEPNEENPMIGWRGASRYYSNDYKPAFGLECQAIKYLRDQMGLKNVIVMIPFCRTLEECQKVQDTMAEFGLVRGENRLKVYIMCEVPSNVILAREFCQLVDGFSIGSNDLTQLTLGLDRDSELVSHLYDERNPAVKRMLESVIRVANEESVKIGLCGQGPSDFPDFAQFLVETGINSISVTPDSVVKTIQAIHQIE